MKNEKTDKITFTKIEITNLIKVIDKHFNKSEHFIGDFEISLSQIQTKLQILLEQNRKLKIRTCSCGNEPDLIYSQIDKAHIVICGNCNKASLPSNTRLDAIKYWNHYKFNPYFKVK